MNNAVDYLNVSKYKSGETALQRKVKVNKKSKLYKTAVEFESLFIKQMLNAMKKTINKTGLMKGGMAEDIFEDMLYDEYAKKMAETSNFGLAVTIYKQLSLPANISAAKYK